MGHKWWVPRGVGGWVVSHGLDHILAESNSLIVNDWNKYLAKLDTLKWKVNE